MLTDIEYIKLFNDCVINKDQVGTVNHIIVDKILPNRSRYEYISLVIKYGQRYADNIFFKRICFVNDSYFDASDYAFAGKESGILKYAKNDSITSSYYAQLSPELTTPSTGAQIPWYVIACIHYRESGLNFSKHLHNGDPLSGFTKQVPSGYPKLGHKPPFTFEESAVDALKLRKLDKCANWSLPKILGRLEAYNGAAKAYYTHHINTPYLWGGSNLYTKGGFPRDHVFSTDYVNKQLGVAVLLKGMEQKGVIAIPRQ